MDLFRYCFATGILGQKSSKFLMNNAEINVHQKNEKDSLFFEVDNLNLLVDNFEVDSTTEMIPERFLFANDVRLHGDYISIHHRSNGDFYQVNQFYVSTREADIKLNGVYQTTNNKNEFGEKPKMILNIDNVNILDLDFFNFTQNQRLEVKEIHIDNADVHYAKNIDANGKTETSMLMNSDLRKYHLEKNLDKPIPLKRKYLQTLPNLWNENYRRKNQF